MKLFSPWDRRVGWYQSEAHVRRVVCTNEITSKNISNFNYVIVISNTLDNNSWAGS